MLITNGEPAAKFTFQPVNDPVWDNWLESLTHLIPRTPIGQVRARLRTAIEDIERAIPEARCNAFAGRQVVNVLHGWLERIEA